MVKRHEALIPLSQEHHSHLVYAKRLRDGKPNFGKSNWPLDESELLLAVKQYFETDMLNHFKLEEDIVFKVYASYLADDDTVKKELLQFIIVHHEFVKAKIAELTSFSGEILKQKLYEIGVAITDHIHKEERQLFQDIQETIPLDELIALSIDLKAKSNLSCSHLL